MYLGQLSLLLLACEDMSSRFITSQDSSIALLHEISLVQDFAGQSFTWPI